MYIQGLIPGNPTELAEAVPIDIYLSEPSLLTYAISNQNH